MKKTSLGLKSLFKWSILREKNYFLKKGLFWDQNDAKLSHLRFKNVFIKEKGRTMDATSK